MKCKDEISKLLEKVYDPEIPVLNILELGIVRDIKYEEDLLIVDITPTYSGCPAIEVMKDDICSQLIQSGISKFEINVIYSPAWTTDWLTGEALTKLREYGIAPPSQRPEDNPLIKEKIRCPYCKSDNTDLKSFFGSTACKSLYYCSSCNQPFEHFKKF